MSTSHIASLAFGLIVTATAGAFCSVMFIASALPNVTA